MVKNKLSHHFSIFIPFCRVAGIRSISIKYGKKNNRCLPIRCDLGGDLWIQNYFLHCIQLFIKRTSNNIRVELKTSCCFPAPGPKPPQKRLSLHNEFSDKIKTQSAGCVARERQIWILIDFNPKDNRFKIIAIMLFNPFALATPHTHTELCMQIES